MSVATYTILLDACGDSDHGDDEGSRPIGCEPEILQVQGFEDAASRALAYIETHRLAPGNWRPAIVHDANGRLVAKIDYRGCVRSVTDGALLHSS